MQFKHIFGMICAAIASASFGPTILSAQPYSISWFTIDSGGGYSTGSNFELDGTIGQHDAGFMSGGSYELSGGFWAAAQESILLGDVNLDSVVNLLDVDPFIDRISTGTYQVEADINEDGVVNLLDVDPFILLLSG
jgi:hypothetical protein